jgi:hypothetical protein
MKKTTIKKPLAENKLRQLIRREITRLMEAEETEEVPQEEPQPEEEEGMSADFQEALNYFLRKLRSSTDSVGDGDLVELAGTVIDTFAASNESKLNILKQIRNNIVR